MLAVREKQKARQCEPAGLCVLGGIVLRCGRKELQGEIKATINSCL
jgi:hypothetical protein